jgi:hypothetical protein
MAKVRIGEGAASLEASYREYLGNRKTLSNERYRKPDETIFDALSSKEADFTVGAEGQKIADYIRRYK